MFKRVRWAGAGMLLGAGASMWAERRVKAAASRYLPREVADEAARRARRLGDDVREALDDGRAAMRLREAELRRRWAPAGAADPPDVVARSRPAGRALRRPE